MRRFGPDPNLLPHVLVITEPEPGEKEWEIEHHEGCPAACEVYWNLYGQTLDDYGFGGGSYVYPGPDEGHRTCYVEWEVDNNGIDSLDVYTLEGDAHLEGERPKWGIDEWRRLRPGRYVFEGWYHDGRGAGEFGGQGDPDGGLTLTSWEPA